MFLRKRPMKKPKNSCPFCLVIKKTTLNYG